MQPTVIVGPDLPCVGAFIRGKDIPGHARRHSAVSCAKMAEPFDLPFGRLATNLENLEYSGNSLNMKNSWNSLGILCNLSQN